MYIIIGLLAIVFGIIFVIRPETSYELEEWWKSNGGEPSETYLKITRIGGAASVIIGIAAIIFQIFFMNK